MSEPSAVRQRQALNDICAEYLSARNHYPAFHSAHEGWAVIQEELDEVWELVRKNHGLDLKVCPHARKEAIQVAAMAMAFALEICE